jgi:hypothetical protein
MSSHAQNTVLFKPSNAFHLKDKTLQNMRQNGASSSTGTVVLQVWQCSKTKHEKTRRKILFHASSVICAIQQKLVLTSIFISKLFGKS